MRELKQAIGNSNTSTIQMMYFCLLLKVLLPPCNGNYGSICQQHSCVNEKSLCYVTLQHADNIVQKQLFHQEALSNP